MNKFCVNRKQCVYLLIFVIGSIGIAGLHWIFNPYKLAVWVQSSVPGYISVTKQCAGKDAVSITDKHPVIEGYFQYELKLPKCPLQRIIISNSSDFRGQQVLSSAAITYYGKEVYRLRGAKRVLEGEGIHARDTRPNRTESDVLNSPLALSANNFDTSEVRIQWPRYLPLILFPVLWILSWVLARGELSHEEKFSLHTTTLVAVALSLITAMAIVARTDVSVHPDELTHVASARYYYDHWLKPKIGASETLDAYKTNVYGVAYLEGTDPVYQVAAKFAVMVWPLFENDVLALRAFNVALFGLMALLAIRFSDVRLAIIPLLATPQAWYIFSYFNGDALPLFLSILAMILFLRLSNSGKTRVQLGVALIAGCLAGGILLSKPNYWTVLGAIALLLLARTRILSGSQFSLMVLGWLCTLVGVFLIASRATDTPNPVALLSLIVGIGLLLGLGYLFIRNSLNAYKAGTLQIKTIAAVVFGLSAVIGLKMIDEARQNPLPFSAARSEALSDVRESMAEPPYKPSARGENALIENHRMRDQGIGLGKMLLERPWFKDSVMSFLGVYGYTNISPTEYFSSALSLAQLLMFISIMLLVMMLSARRNPEKIDLLVPLSLVTGILTAFAASVGFSWMYDYQPQGRYLFPILPILAGGLLVAGESASNSRVLHWAVIGAFLLSAMSFGLIALRWIPKFAGIY